MMNVIVLMSDTFRWDHLSGICPNSQLKTPFIENFSKNCIMFDDHYSGSIPTLPNRTDLFLGKYHLAQGGGWRPLRKDMPTLAGLMKDAGYRTQLICSTPHMLKNDGYFNRGFQFYDWIRNSEADLFLCPGDEVLPEVRQPVEKARHTFDYPGLTLGPLTEWMRGRCNWEEDLPAPIMAQTASKWLEWNYKDGPFFLWWDSFDPHEPWLATEYLRKRFDPTYKGIPIVHPNYGNSNVFTKRELQNLRANYKAACTFADKWVGHLLQKMYDLGLMENTMIIFTSDHGIYLGEHQRTGKDNHNDYDDRHWPVYNEVTHIPMAIYHPKAKGSRHVKGFTQSVDMTKTILEGVGAKHPKDLHGKSLIPQILGKDKRAQRKYVVSGRSVDTPAIFTGKWLYHPIGEGKKPALYDMEADRTELKDLTQKYPQKAEQLKSMYESWAKRCGVQPWPMKKDSKKQ